MSYNTLPLFVVRGLRIRDKMSIEKRHTNPVQSRRDEMFIEHVIPSLLEFRRNVMFIYFLCYAHSVPTEQLIWVCKDFGTKVTPFIKTSL